MLFELLLFLIIISIILYIYYVNLLNKSLILKKQSQNQNTNTGLDSKNTPTNIETVNTEINPEQQSGNSSAEINNVSNINEINSAVTNDTSLIVSLDDTEKLTGINADKFLEKLNDSAKQNLILTFATLPVSIAFNNIVKYVLLYTSKVLISGTGIIFRGTSTILIKGLERSGAKILSSFAARGAAKLTLQTSTSLAIKATVSGVIGTATKYLTVIGLVGSAIDLADVFGNNAVTNYNQQIKAGDDNVYIGSTSTYKKAYYGIKSNLDSQFQKIIEENGGKYPIITGPLTKLEEDKLIEELNLHLEPAILEYFNNLDNIKNLQEYMKTVPASKLISEESIGIVIAEYVGPKLVDIQMKLLCKSKGGKIINIDGQEYCTYESQDATNSSYNWPLTESDIYSEWKISKNSNGEDEGYSVLADPSMKIICKDNNLEYNTNTGICEIKKEYCLSRGLDWKYDDEIKQEDCYLDPTQNIFEYILGTSVLRFMKQVFDPAQYNSCQDGDIDDGYFCRSVKCGEGEELQDGLCYPTCKENFYGVGPVCWRRCPDGFGDGGTFCTKPTAYGVGAGYAFWDRDKCPNDPVAYNHNDNKTNFSSDNSCEWNGALYYPRCKPGYHKVGCCICSPDCPSDTDDNGAFCTKGSYGRGVGKVPNINIYAKTRIANIGGK